MYYDRKRIHRISKNLNSYSRKEEKVDGDEHSGQSSPVNTALGTAVALPGLAIDAVTTLPAGLLKKPVDKLMELSLNMKDKFDDVVSDPLMEKAAKTDSAIASIGLETLSLVSIIPVSLVAYSLLFFGGALKVPLFIIEKAGSLLSKPFKLAGKNILKKGNKGVYEFVKQASEIEPEFFND